MVRQALKLTEALSEMNFTLRVLHNFHMEPKAALASAILAPQNFVVISSFEHTNCEYSEASIDDRLDFVLYEKEDTPKSTVCSKCVDF